MQGGKKTGGDKLRLFVIAETQSSGKNHIEVISTRNIWNQMLIGDLL